LHIVIVNLSWIFVSDRFLFFIILINKIAQDFVSIRKDTVCHILNVKNLDMTVFLSIEHRNTVCLRMQIALKKSDNPCKLFKFFLSLFSLYDFCKFIFFSLFYSVLSKILGENLLFYIYCILIIQIYWNSSLLLQSQSCHFKKLKTK